MIASQVDKSASDTRARRYFQLTASVGDKGSFAVSRTYALLTALRLSAFHFFQLNADAPDVSTGNRSARSSFWNSVRVLFPRRLGECRIYNGWPITDYGQSLIPLESALIFTTWDSWFFSQRTRCSSSILSRFLCKKFRILW